MPVSFNMYFWLEYTTLDPYKFITECNDIRKFAIKTLHYLFYSNSVTDLQVGADHMTFSQRGI